MAKIFSVIPIELQPGITEQEFFKFFIEQYAPLGARMGWIGHVLKADRGERSGKVAVIWEIPSVEQRDRFVPAQNQLTEEGKRVLGPEFDEVDKKLYTYVTGWPLTHYIDQGG